MSDLPLPCGARFGRYEIAHLLGTGGMGSVYLAQDTHLHRPVALKVLPRGVADDTASRRFRAEVLTLSGLNHPNIVTVFDAGELDGRPFLAMERIDGRTLRQQIARAPLQFAEAIAVFRQVARALAAAHAAGIIHRDVKPENVMIRPDGIVKVLDFGLAKLAPELPGAAALTELSGRQPMIGTPAYMAPEQMRGAAVSPQTDFWAFGILLQEALTGARPFPGENLGDTIAAVLEGAPRPLALAGPVELVEPLADLVRRCLAKEQEDRPSDAMSIEIELAAIARQVTLEEGTVVTAAAPSTSGATSSGATPPRTAIEERSTQAESDAGALPTPWTPFVPRGDEIAQLLDRLRRGRERLVTLTGPGGTGKTRLAIEAARRFGELEAVRVVFVPLETVTDPGLVLPAIARGFGLDGGAGDSGAAPLRDYLRHRRALLVLDNFEQVVAAAPALAELVRSADGLQVLATSREPLRVRGERELPVAPLPVPDADLLVDPADLARIPAVELFLDRARAVRPDLTLDAVSAPLVAEICRRLDGLPLALELAAARTKLLPLATLRDQLAQGLALLTAGARDLSPRQRTMEAAIAWSYELLGEAERRLFRRICVFRGGFDLNAASEVVGAQSDLLELLSSLVEKSFVRPETETSDVPRFSLLQTIQAFGEQRLADSPVEHSEALAAHRDGFLRRAESAGRALAASADEATLSAVARDHDNFRAAIERAIAAADSDGALRLAGGLWQYWYVRGHYEEARRSLEAALALAGDAAGALALRATLGAGVFAFLQCDYAHAESLLDRALVLAQGQADARLAAMALQYLGSLARERGRCQAAIALHTEAAAAFRALGDRQSVARSSNLVGLASWLDGRLDEAAAAAREALAYFDARGDCEGSTWARLNLAAAHLFRGELVEAAALATEARQRAAGGVFREGIAWSLELAGRVALARADWAAARESLPRSLELHARLGDRWRMASVLEALAALRLALGSATAAARLIGAAEKLRTQAGMPVPRVERLALDQVLAALRRELGEGRLTAEMATGAALPRRELVVEALRSQSTKSTSREPRDDR